MGLRDYQQDALESVRSAYLSGETRQLIVLPTGTGKMVVAAHVPEAIGMRRGEQQMLFLAHRDELIYQAAEKLAKYNPRLAIEIEKAEQRACPDMDIVVASVQSLCRMRNGEYSPRLRKFDADKFLYIQVDEAHHIPGGQSYANVLRYFGVLKGDSNCDERKLLLGHTATPFRGDSYSLSAVFDKIVYHKPIREMVKAGWLVHPIAWRISTSTDISEVETRAGDFQLDQLTEAIDNPQRNGLIVRQYAERSQGMTAFAFTTTIKHSEHLAEEFRRQGISAAPISGETPRDERRRLLQEHATGRVRVLASCGVLSEGVDVPSTGVAVMARPTKSALLYAQQVGRVLRPYPAPEDIDPDSPPPWIKPRAIVLDFCDNSGKHSLITIARLLGLPVDFDFEGKNAVQAAERIEQLALQYPNLDISGARSVSHVKTIIEQVDLLGDIVVPHEAKLLSRFTWIKRGGSFHLVLPDRLALHILPNQLEQYEIYWREDLIDTARDLESAFAIADNLVPDEHIGVVLARAKWRKEEPTPKQTGVLYDRNRALRRQFGSADEFHAWCLKRFKAGIAAYNRGGVCQQLNALSLGG